MNNTEDLQQQAEKAAMLLISISDERTRVRETLRQLDEDYLIAQHQLALLRSQLEISRLRQRRLQSHENPVQSQAGTAEAREAS